MQDEALLTAADYGHYRCVRILLKNDANVQATDDSWANVQATDDSRANVQATDDSRANVHATDDSRANVQAADDSRANVQATDNSQESDKNNCLMKAIERNHRYSYSL